MRNVLLIAAILSLMAGLWYAWGFFQGWYDRGQMLVRFNLTTLAWFLLATIWTYTDPRPSN
jgi:hypothetical protein